VERIKSIVRAAGLRVKGLVPEDPAATRKNLAEILEAEGLSTSTSLAKAKAFKQKRDLQRDADGIRDRIRWEFSFAFEELDTTNIITTSGRPTRSSRAPVKYNFAPKVNNFAIFSASDAYVFACS
jgi:hypothetical protein